MKEGSKEGKKGKEKENYIAVTHSCFPKGVDTSLGLSDGILVGS